MAGQVSERFKKIYANSQNNFCRRLVVIFLTCITVAAVAFLLLIGISKSKDKGKIECLVQYLKNEENVYDECFDSVSDFYGDYQSCASEVRDNLNNILDATKLRLNQQIGQRQYTTCVMNQLRNHESYNRNILLAQVMDYARVSWTFWKYFDRNSHLKQIEEALKTVESNEVKYCVNDFSERSRVDVEYDDGASSEGSGYQEYFTDSRARREIPEDDRNLKKIDDDLFFIM